MRLRHEHESGFSLVELMVAMVVTMIVTGAIYGLLTGGQNAFRREPEMTDRQQNIRLAMDLIMRDVAAAGANMPAFMQTFTTGLNGESLAACTDNGGNTVPCPVGPGGLRTDELEMMTNSAGHAIEEACHYPGGSASVGRMAASTTNVQDGDVVIVLLDNGRWTLRSITGPPSTNNTKAGLCDTGDHTQVSFNNGAADNTGYNVSNGICGGTAIPSGTEGTAACVSCITKDKGVDRPLPGNTCCEPNTGCNVAGFLAGEQVRYRIRNGKDGVPNLERFSSGRVTNFTSTGRPLYQVIARGIDDLQIVYTPAQGGQVNDAPVVGQTNVDFANLTQTVTVTLSSRSEARNIAGAKTVVSGPTALRGTLTSSGTPRAVLATLGTQVNDRGGSWSGGLPSGQPTPWF